MTAHSFGHFARRQITTARGKGDSRKKLIGAVHASASRLGIADDDRRKIQEDVTGKASLADMTLAEIGQVLDKLNKDRSAERSTRRPYEAKIRALWWTLHWLGEPLAREPNDFAINRFIENRFGVSNLRFVDHSTGSKIIEGLKAIAVRAGVVWPGEALLKKVRADHNPKANIQQLERVAVIKAIWIRLHELGAVRTGLRYYDYLGPALGLDPDQAAFWSETQLDTGIRILGKKLRRLITARAAREGGEA